MNVDRPLLGAAAAAESPAPPMMPAGDPAALRRRVARAVERKVLELPGDGGFVALEPGDVGWPLPPGAEAPRRAWKSRQFLAQLFDLAADGAPRLSVMRTRATELLPKHKRDLRPISWDELMAVKAAVGLGAHWAVEVLPPNDQVVDVAPMRHLWLLGAQPPFGWRRGA